jgi:opacity protein-like surface antigen
MRSLKQFALAIAMLGVSANAGFAADIVEPPVYEAPPEVVAVGGGGWYLRGDIGYAKIHTAGVEYYQATPTLTGSFESHDISSTWMIGGGIGYQVNDWFRVDWTANHFFNTDFDGSSATGVTCSSGAPAVCDYADTGDVNITTFLANAYVDLGNFSGFTPYVGAGIGGAMVHWGEITNDETCVSNCGTWVEADSVHGGYSDLHFAYALHGGVSYDISANLKLDAGYSFTHIEGGRMFGFESGNANSGVQGFNDDIKIHAFRAGLRYQFH